MLFLGPEDLELRGIQIIALLRSARKLRHEKTCCHSNSSEKSSANVDVKNSQRSKIVIIIIIIRRRLLETKLNSRNLIKGKNAWAVSLVWYSGPFLKWTRDELKQMDQRTRKLMTMYKALHPRDDVDRLYVSRKEVGRWLASIEDSVDASIQLLKDYIQKHEGGLITATRNDTENTMNNTMTITWKQKWEGKQLYGRFKQLINIISHDKTWTWLRKGNFKRETKSLLIAAQDSALKTNHIKARIVKTQQNSKCRLCGDRDETINHIISECSKLAQREYKARNDFPPYITRVLEEDCRYIPMTGRNDKHVIHKNTNVYFRCYIFFRPVSKG